MNDGVHNNYPYPNECKMLKNLALIRINRLEHVIKLVDYPGKASSKIKWLGSNNGVFC